MGIINSIKSGIRKFGAKAAEAAEPEAAPVIEAAEKAEEAKEEEAKAAKEEKKAAKAESKYYQSAKNALGRGVSAAGSAAKEKAKGILGGFVFDPREPLDWFILFALLLHVMDFFSFRYMPGSTERMFLYLVLALAGLLVFKAIDVRSRFFWMTVLWFGSIFLVVVTNWIQGQLKNVPAVPIFIMGFTNIVFLPLFLYFAILFYKDSTPWADKWKIAFVVLIVFFAIMSVPANEFQTVKETISPEQIAGLSGIWQQMKDGANGAVKVVTNLPTIAGTTYQKLLTTATGGYQDQYLGKVEQNKDLPLGVNIENVKASSPIFYSGEPVIVFATITARTLDEPVTIIPKCSANNDEYLGTIPLGTFNGQKIKNFTIYTFESQPIECDIDLPKGSQRIDIYADYNFRTLAYHKMYFIDADRMRSLERQKIDPFTQYKITDRNPITTYTNGPVEIGMDFGGAIRSIGSMQPLPTLGITITNRWLGKFTKINQLIIYVPDGFSADPARCTDFEDFRPTTEDINYQKGYKAYSLRTDRINNLLENLQTGSLTYRTFRCGLQIDNTAQVLGTSPISTLYFKATASYRYTITQAVSVNIQQGFEEAQYPPSSEAEKPFAYTPQQSVVDAIVTNYNSTIANLPGGEDHHRLVAAVVAAESGGNPNAVSPTNAKGLMQFIGSTAIQYGLCSEQGCDVWDDRLIPDRALNAGSRYLIDLKAMFSSMDIINQEKHAIASYNGGEGLIKLAVKKTGRLNPGWDETAAQLTEELLSSTRTYADGRCWSKTTNTADSSKCWTPESRARKIDAIKKYVDAVLSYKKAFEGKIK